MGTRVFVGGLTYRVRERDIEKFFRKYGRIKEVAMKNGFAFVEFDDYRDADDAVYELNGKELLGERVSVERARGTPRGCDQWRGSGGRGYGPPRGRSRDKYGPPTRTEYRLIVENLSSRVSWQDLKDYMRQAGEVTYADAHKQRRNEGVVEFASYSDMKNAIDKLDDTELNGRRIRLVEDRRRGSRRSRSSSSRSRSRSRSPRRRSRSRSRSRSHRSSRSKSRDRSKSKSAAHSKSRSRSKSKEASKSRSRSRSHSKRSKSRSCSKENGAKNRSRSRSMSKEGSKSRSQSPTKENSPEKHD
ncbi:serine-arginine protein 55 isoform X2 [Tribolium castaneum]|uniref:Serine-arginine protein 55-like Protein n=1 Tax=Tribolium castaneum TaxID=7070 RepID=A0A139WNV8_TRICA|nr:PREDICTED: serine-arginine protein 55 isoform X2 [Tribolium castaneum]XP_044257282.1 serine-arginine protein 55-like isoform X2 [Tribolium madens]KYB29603.1 Serine-arginine protein 55-like Protein [Tribolium castaneum]|eukprot:XP_001812208.1 PREDICTED: serine-arginine protein 55 isoform X2 [Tribolium castaneum]